MENEKRLIDAHDLWSDIMMLPHNGDMISSDEVEQAIMDAPTVDAVEVVHGRWARKQIGKYTGADEVCCSVCGCWIGVVSSDTGFREAIEGMNYCPNCGADMRERSEWE